MNILRFLFLGLIFNFNTTQIFAIEPVLSILKPNYDQDKNTASLDLEKRKKWALFKEINCTNKSDKANKLINKISLESEIIKQARGAITKTNPNTIVLKFKGGSSLEFKSSNENKKSTDAKQELSKIFISSYWNQLNYIEIVHLDNEVSFLELIDMNTGIGTVLDLGQLFWSPNGEYMVNLSSRNELKAPNDPDKMTIYSCKDRSKSCQKLTTELMEDIPNNIIWSCDNKFKTSLNECKCQLDECTCRNYQKKEIKIKTGWPVWAQGMESEQKPSSVTKIISSENPFIVLPNLVKVDFSKLPILFGKSVSIALIFDSEINKKANDASMILRADLSDPRIIQIILPLVVEPDTLIPITIYSPEISRKQTEDRQPMLYTVNSGEFKPNFVEFDEEKNTYYALIKNCSDQADTKKFGQSICSMKLGLMKVMQIQND